MIAVSVIAVMRQMSKIINPTAYVQDVKKDMSRFNSKISAQKAEWYCASCGSNSMLPVEYGCIGCQPFKSEKLIYRIYKEKA